LALLAVVLIDANFTLVVDAFGSDIAHVPNASASLVTGARRASSASLVAPLIQVSALVGPGFIACEARRVASRRVRRHRRGRLMRATITGCVRAHPTTACPTLIETGQKSRQRSHSQRFAVSKQTLAIELIALGRTPSLAKSKKGHAACHAERCTSALSQMRAAS